MGAKMVAYNALLAAIRDSGQESVYIDDWRAAAYRAGVSSTSTSQDAKKRAFRRAVNDLRNAGYVETRDDYWRPRRDTGQGRDNGGTCPGTI